MINRISAVFDSADQAEQAIRELRDLGLTDTNLSVIARQGDTALGGGGGGVVAERPVEETGKVGAGLAAGAGLGAIFGLASAFIPGVGPFMAAGALAATIGTVGASTVAGAVVGGATGALAGALIKYGYSEEEAKYYGPEIERGGYLLTVDTTNTTYTSAQVWDILRRNGGRSAPGSAWLT
jgi:hypothetical protein